MRVCPSCEAELGSGFLKCGDCDVELVEPGSSPAMTQSQRVSAKAVLEQQATTAIVEAGLAACREIERELLENDVLAYVDGTQSDDAALGSANVNRFSVVIAEDDLARASRLLQGRFEALTSQEGIGSLSLTPIDLSLEEVVCPACAHEGALVAGACADCGLYLGAPEN